MLHDGQITPASPCKPSGQIRGRLAHRGIHTGECEIVGGKLAGIAVHTCARVAAAAPGEVLVSSTVKALVAGSGIHFEDRGTNQLKGIDETWQLFRLVHD
jgi:class 3 adenylate cyclase